MNCLLKKLKIAIQLFSLLCSLISFSQSLSPKKFKKEICKKNSILIDVRTAEEYNNEHLYKSINIDYQSPTFNERIDSLNRGKRYFIYCGTGKRSKKAYDQFKTKAFKNVYELEGGLESWKKNKFPTIK